MEICKIHKNALWKIKWNSRQMSKYTIKIPQIVIVLLLGILARLFSIFFTVVYQYVLVTSFQPVIGQKNAHCYYSAPPPSVCSVMTDRSKRLT